MGERSFFSRFKKPVPDTVQKPNQTMDTVDTGVDRESIERRYAGQAAQRAAQREQSAIPPAPATTEAAPDVYVHPQQMPALGARDAKKMPVIDVAAVIKTQEDARKATLLSRQTPTPSSAEPMRPNNAVRQMDAIPPQDKLSA